MKLSGRIALITGSSSGIGRATAFYMAEEGADVAVNYRSDENGAKEVVKKIEDMGHKGLAVRADVTSTKEVKEMFEKVNEKFSTLDILVNNAGIANILPTVEMTDEAWDRMLAVHLTGTMKCTREALKIMLKKKSGKIINVASICALEGCLAASHYSAAKGGIIGFTRAVAQEVAPHGINVNAVAPGYVETPLLSKAGVTEEMIQGMMPSIPLGRIGKPHEIASLIAYLATEDANYFVGQVISPNGGMTI
jgi:3-oxoacyl-[acyl-carrier protein] reductase